MKHSAVNKSSSVPVCTGLGKASVDSQNAITKCHQVAAQYWLVGAYNDKFGGFSGDNRNKSSGNDYYKLKGVTVERPPVEVPEPGTLLLMLTGLLGLGWTRRRSTSA